jgi:tetratricopeptide (TPR) repeat protein
MLYFMGESERATERIEQALEMAEPRALLSVVSEALNTKGIILSQARARPQEGLSLVRHSLRVALDAGAPLSALRAYFNLACTSLYEDAHEEALSVSRDGIAYARRFGNRNWEASLMSIAIGALTMRGEWDQALDDAGEFLELVAYDVSDDVTALRFAAVELLSSLPLIHVARGRVDEADRFVERFADFRDSADFQERSAHAAGTMLIKLGRGALEEALASGRAAFAAHEQLGPNFAAVKLGFAGAAQAAAELGDLAQLESLLGSVDSFGVGARTPFVEAQAKRSRARLAAARGEAEEADNAFQAAATLMRETSLPFWVAVTQLEHSEWLDEQGRGDEAEALRAESRAVFEGLGAAPWLERATRDRTVVS